MRTLLPHFCRVGFILAFLFLYLPPFGENILAQDKNTRGKKEAGQAQAQHDSLARVAAREIELDQNWDLGFQHYRNQQYAAAVRYFWKVVEMDTARNGANTSSAATRRFPQVFGLLGQAYFHLNQPDSALLVYELGVNAFPNEADLRRNLASLRAAAGQFDSALAEYKRIIRLGAATEDDYRSMANLYVRINQYDKAIPVLEKILAVNPNDTETRQALSALHHANGDSDAALAEMENALAQNPNDARAMIDLAQARFNRQEYEKVIELLPRYHKLVPSDLWALELLGKTCVRLGRYRESLQAFEQIIAANPEDKKVLVKMSDCYRELGDFAAARRFANKALTIDSKYGAAYIALARVYEACAEKCVAQKGNLGFDDKLVYELAYFQYEKALQDLETGAAARQQLKLLEPSIPNKDDRLTNKGKDKASGSCYQWIY
jgi:tetratricopeptide (TPR) repeat protein